MKQGNLRGFGTEYLTGAVPPQDMADEVVTMCVSSEKPEAVAISLSIQYAKARFGYRQIDIARLCGWKRDNHLSAYAKGSAPLTDDPRRWERFARVTGCRLLFQVRERIELAASINGQVTANSRERMALALMLRVA